MKQVTNDVVLQKLEQLYQELFIHNGYGQITIDMKLLSRGEKEVILCCGKEYRFVVHCDECKQG